MGLQLIFMIIMGLTVAVIWQFKRITAQIIADRQRYHPEMTTKKIRASRRVYYRSTIKKTPQLRRLNWLQMVGWVVLLIGIGISGGLLAGIRFSALVDVIGIGCLVIGGLIGAIGRELLNQRLIKMTTVPDTPPNQTLLVTPQRLASRERRLLSASTVMFLAITLWIGVSMGVNLVTAINTQRTHVVTKVSAANQNVQQIQSLPVDNQDLTTRAKMTLFSMYFKDITNYDLDDNSIYTTHVIHTKTKTWYVLVENSEDNGRGFYYLVKEDAQHRIQMYHFQDRNGAKTALHGLVPAYTPYYQTEVKLGQLTTAFMTQKQYQTIIKRMQPGQAWHYQAN